MSGRGPRATGIVAEVSLFFAAVFVGLDFVSVKYALERIPPLTLVSVRYVLAGMMLLALLRFSWRKAGIGWRDLPAMFGLGLVGVALNQVGYTAGLALTSGPRGAASWASGSPSRAWPWSSARDSAPRRPRWRATCSSA